MILLGCLHCGEVSIEVVDYEHTWQECPECGARSAMTMEMAVDLINKCLREHVDVEDDIS